VGNIEEESGRDRDRERVRKKEKERGRDREREWERYSIFLVNRLVSHHYPSP
jgi:hypothetical protein